LTEEVRFFRRVSIYAFVVGATYWFVSYEPAGTALLLLFGVSTGVGTLLLWRGARGRRPSRGGADATAGYGLEGATIPGPDGPFGDETGRVPTPTFSPFLVAVAVALIALGLVFGAWFALAALIPLAVGTGGWLSSVRGELAGVEMDDQPVRAELPPSAAGRPEAPAEPSAPAVEPGDRNADDDPTDRGTLRSWPRSGRPPAMPARWAGDPGARLR
jgi:hypothetical protein